MSDRPHPAQEPGPGHRRGPRPLLLHLALATMNSNGSTGASPSAAQTKQYLDLGPYPLDAAGSVSLEHPSTLPAFSTDGLISDLGDGVTRGDGVALRQVFFMARAVAPGPACR